VESHSGFKTSTNEEVGLKEVRLGLAIAFGIFAGLSAWTMIFAGSGSAPTVQGAKFIPAAFADGCGESMFSPCYIKVVN